MQEEEEIVGEVWLNWQEGDLWQGEFMQVPDGEEDDDQDDNDQLESLSFILQHFSLYNSEAESLRASVTMKPFFLRYFLLFPPHLSFDDNDSNSTIAAVTSNSQLPMSAEELYYAEVTRVLQTGIDLNEADLEGCTALHLAATVSTVKMVKLLLYFGADLHAQMKNGDTPLHCAARNYQADIAQLLIAFGAELDVHNIFGQSPLDISVENQLSLNRSI